MKQMMLFFKRNSLALFALLAISVTFSACKKDKVEVHNPAAGLMAFNLVSDANPIGVALSGNVFTTSPLLYTNYTGGYLPIYVGTRTVEAFDFQTRESLSSSNQTFRDSGYYSLFVVGANNKVSNVLVEDKFDELQTGNNSAFVRYINAVPDSSVSNVVIDAAGTSVFNNESKFKEVTEFKPVAPGELSVKISNEGSIDKSRTITLEQDKAYTILLTGNPEATNESQKVEIKFIENGTIS